MSFQEDCVRFGDQLAQLVDAGVPAKEAAAVIGLSRQRCYAIPRAIGRPVGRTGTADPRQIVTGYRETGSITRAATASGVSQVGGPPDPGGRGPGRQREDPTDREARSEATLPRI